MNTFYQMWGVKTPAEAKAKIAEQKAEEVEKLKAKCEKLGLPCEPTNLEEQALMLVGRDIYEKLIKNYTEKQWGRKCTELPAFIIKRLPVRLIFDNNYFNDKYQGIPEGGYTKLVEAMIGDCEVRLSTDYFEHKAELDALADKVIYTGEIDRYYDYKFGHLQYRTVSFETELLEGVSNYQGNAVVNYTDSETPFTRIIEHKHFEFGNQPDTVISREFSKEWQPGDEPYYPVNDERNSELYAKYKALAYAEKNVIFGGRLAEYKYYDMHKVIESAMEMVENLA
jgi:UDP-galactopyranose mutase